ncbi:phosphoglycerate dehydrogenase [Acetilactobacillus jinshanensis]|uniref:3-phosphoglycerate dehydrogenase n=1 Tax=Acetilactobacillus jinshanensis TaxID=1720083 RepID=A0A4P6ZJ54_9LACO|nr:phosphoglycerate dehydrogenase [Acetilactobacillus jinshanensis]QBP17755.1 3-phosphoglycerate dehydrogenase [Acetilactobacillus jinshanensis]URL60616.1 phosphoglycerate dehydrogenase [uncultured bacterium]
MKKVLIPSNYKNILTKLVRQDGFQPVCLKDQQPSTILAQAPDISGAMLMVGPFPGSLMKKLPNLKIVTRMGVGYDNVDYKAAAKQGIWATHTPGSNQVSVAENTVADILVLSKRLFTTSSLMRGEQPIANYKPRILKGKTVGVVGYGHIARQVIKMLSGFGVKILIWDRHPKTSKYGKFVDWKTLFTQSDYVTLHIPATADTTHCVNMKTFKMMKNSAFIVNFGRGTLINQTDMVNALKQHEIQGAALDVFEKEPLPKQSQLRQLPNVFITPHCAGKTVESHRKTAEMAERDVARVLNGKEPLYPVNQPK